jgi:hypothetical protein
VLAHVKQNAETKQKLGLASQASLAVGISQAGWPRGVTLPIYIPSLLTIVIAIPEIPFFPSPEIPEFFKP